MALFNEIQVGRYNRFVQKLLSMKGPPSMPTVSTDMVFMHPLFTGVENLWLQGWDLFAFFQTLTASAANKATLELRNPKGSNVVAVLTRATFLDTTTAGIPVLLAVRGATTDQPSVQTVQALDARGRPGSTCILSSNNGAAQSAIGGTNLNAIFQTSEVNESVDMLRPGEELPLLPGDALVLVAGNNATPDEMGMTWRERALEDSERA